MKFKLVVEGEAGSKSLKIKAQLGPNETEGEIQVLEGGAVTRCTALLVDLLPGALESDSGDDWEDACVMLTGALQDFVRYMHTEGL